MVIGCRGIRYAVVQPMRPIGHRNRADRMYEPRYEPSRNANAKLNLECDVATVRA